MQEIQVWIKFLSAQAKFQVIQPQGLLELVCGEEK